ncbi:MAG: PPOX class F420-dependent oxidoreductase [Actinomycetota bacterium]
MRWSPLNLPEAGRSFLTERHLASLTTLRRDGSPHVVPIGFTFDFETATAWIITSGESQKVRNINASANSRAVVCQVDGRRWLSLEGTASIHGDHPAVKYAEQRYAERYRIPRVNPRRVAIKISVQRILGNL